MAWRLAWKPDGENERDLTDAELLAVSIILAHHMGEPMDAHNVYWRAWDKLQPAIEVVHRNARED